jgi:CRISPR-associated protein Cmr6
MPIAAVPLYLGNDFSEASPGLRFGMYLRLWGLDRRTQALLWETHDVGYEVRGQQREERPVKYENKVAALSDAKRLSPRDKGTMSALATRQSALADTLPPEQLLRLDALATAPFTTGLGNEHPLENGFAFLNPYGLPYLPGSGIKGVLCQAARELASGDWGETHGWDIQLPSPASGRGAGGEGITAIEALFGKEDSNDAQRGALTFWDVIPRIAGDHLAVEIMTPHQGHYYQQKEIAGSTSPHDSGQPIPISYLTVPANSGFTFHVVCDLAFLERIAPALAANGRWKELLAAAFEHAFQWLGFGAKTAVGYGAMTRDKEAETRAAKAQADREADAQRRREADERQARLASLNPNQRLVEEFSTQAQQRLEQLRGGKDKPNTGIHTLAQQLAKTALESADWSADEKRALAEALETWLPKIVEKLDKKDDWKDARKKLKLAALKGEA